MLQAYIVDGTFDPRDFGYLEGSFAGASEEEKARFKAIFEWSWNCSLPAREIATAELVERGYDRTLVEKLGGGQTICLQPSFVPSFPEDLTYPEFKEELQRVRPIYETYLVGMNVAGNINVSDEDDFVSELKQRTLGDQMARHALSWGNGITASAPELTPVGLAILRTRIGMETVRRDRDNTEWLKAEVAKNGWPTISAMGEAASHQAWLLVQHADMDPVFQLDALGMMEPLVARGEVSGRNYAYLYDRVMLKLTGKQRYATQFECVDGEFAPQPVEDMMQVARYRAEAGLDTLEENLRRIEERAGPCF